MEQHKVEYSQLAIKNAESFDPMLNRVHPRDNIGLLALLETKEGAWDTNGRCIFISFESFATGYRCLKIKKSLDKCRYAW